ncbi:LANO_0F05006g1_1 [Lachancea nothofagi CBS 11611]|uniref:LANO_0F05006g1_1 n=1 Tax=Lachancea nothofagi CBS 11611 TaxID=1266666 RepID=A0A1G4K7U7_9SACH|nr:LANO_0F05006g1_1 [Lachancea nothofagi CBS 11611]
MAKITKRGRTVITCIVLLYVVLSFRLNSWKVHSGFYKGFKTLLPTTSDVKNVNFKQFQAENLREASVTSLRSQLALQFPYDTSEPIPKRVWQTWKYPLDSPKMKAEFRMLAGRWKDAVGEAPLYEYALISDDHMMPLLRNLYGAVPQVIQAFESLPLPILKADFFRYLILYARGGIYSDIDTYPLKPLDSWPSISSIGDSKIDSAIQYKGLRSVSESTVRELGFVAGIEADPDRVDWNEWYARRIQFCQWTIKSKPGHPLLRELIINITATTLASTNVKSSIEAPEFIIDEDHRSDYLINCRDKRRFDDDFPADQKKTSKNVDGTDTMNWTGPGIFSDAVFEYLNNLIQTNLDISIINNNMKASHESGTQKFYRKITEGLESSATFVKEFFTLIEEPVVVDDVMILPITSFSPGVNNMNAKSDDDEMAFVKHQFTGSWKGKEPKKKKPPVNKQPPVGK